MTDERSRPPEKDRSPECPDCGARMRFSGGEQTHDVWAERYVCPECAREIVRSFGRGSV